MKYIMWQVGDSKVPIIFPDHLIHKDIEAGTARAVRNLWRASGMKTDSPQVVSAGFIPAMAVVSTQGESETLGIKSDPADAKIINMWDYEFGRESIFPGMTGVVIAKTAEMLIECIKNGDY